jgi:acyl dehydratase
MAKLIFENLEEFRAFQGKTFPSGEWITITQEMINDFAKATSDFQWIHTDVEKATQYSPFKKPVAHGFLSLSLLSKMLGDLVQVNSLKMGVNYGLNKVRFPNAVLVDSKLRLNGKVEAIEDYSENGVKITWQCSVEIQGTGKPACVAEFISIMFE